MSIYIYIHIYVYVHLLLLNKSISQCTLMYAVMIHVALDTSMSNESLLAVMLLERNII